MTLTLAVETSSFAYDVALADDNRGIVARRTARLRDPEFRSVGYLVDSMMQSGGYSFNAIDRLAVDVGPGNVISVRAGVSYVNGLAFSLNKPVVGVDSLALLASATGAPGNILCIRNAGGGNVNVALFRAGRRLAGRHGPLADVVPALLVDLDEAVVAGTSRDKVPAVAPGVRITDSGIEFPDVSNLCDILSSPGTADMRDYATPITDASTNSTSVYPL